MRLTNEQRRRMVRDIMGDIPAEDFRAQINARLLELALWRLPQPAAALWRDPKTRGLLHTRSCTIYNDPENNRYECVAGVNLPGYDDEHEAFKRDAKVVDLVEKAKAQMAQRNQIEAELRLTLNTIKTDAELVERLPELRNYLPDKAEAKVANLPATTALLDNLKAAGFPLDKAA